MKASRGFESLLRANASLRLYTPESLQRAWLLQQALSTDPAMLWQCELRTAPFAERLRCAKPAETCGWEARVEGAGSRPGSGRRRTPPSDIRKTMGWAAAEGEYRRRSS